MASSLSRRVLGWQDEHRARIQTSKIIDRLQEHAFGRRDVMTPSQVQTCLALLRKTVPDLTTVTIDSHTEHSHTIQFQWLPPDEPEPRMIEGEFSALTQASPSELPDTDNESSSESLEASQQARESLETVIHSEEGSNDRPLDSETSVTEDQLPRLKLVQRTAFTPDEPTTSCVPNGAGSNGKGKTEK